MNRSIKKVAVLGSGVMGSRIACHFANIGVQVILMDIAPNKLTEQEEKKGLTLNKVKNRIVNDSLQAAIKSNPSPLFLKDNAKLIRTGVFDDNLQDIKTCDWVIEVIVENLDIKKQLLEKVDKLRKPGTLITSNTSSIPIHLMTEGRSDDFKKHFAGSHFFNPPRYLRLLEIIPTPHTDPSITKFLLDYGDRFLGKTTVLCKDTPAFIANRIGVFGVMKIFHLLEELNLTIDEVDRLTGPAIGRPKSATFRTADVIGIDTLVKVANFCYENCRNDEARELFRVPKFVNDLVAANRLGDKTKEGFFKVVTLRQAQGDKTITKKEFHAIDPATGTYKLNPKPRFATLEQMKQVDDLRERLKVAVQGTDKAGEFYRKFFYALFQYVSNRIPEISDTLYPVDDALVAGFGWELGPFATWDALGVQRTAEQMTAAGYPPAPWVTEMLAAGNASFYKTENGRKLCYNPMLASELVES